jgi:hypothetical protein
VQCKTSFFVQEKLYSMLQDVLKDRPGVDIVKLHKSGGVVNRNAKYRQRSRIHKTRVRPPAFSLAFYTKLRLFVSQVGL